MKNRRVRKGQAKEIAKAIIKNYGNLTLVSVATGLTRKQLNNWLRKPERKEILMQARQAIVDISEKRMIELLNSSDEKIVLEVSKFLLSKLGKTNGYGNDPQVQVQVNEPQSMTINEIFGIS